MAKIKTEKSIVFAIPALILYASFMIGPLAAMFYISTLKWTYIIAPPSFLGLDNYRHMFASDAFWTALKNTVLLVATLIPVMIHLAFMFGYLVRADKGRYENAIEQGIVAAMLAAAIAVEMST